MYNKLKPNSMYWNLSLILSLSDAPWPMTKEEITEYINRTTGNSQLLENISELDDYDIYESIEDICPCYEDIVDGLDNSAQD